MIIDNKNGTITDTDAKLMWHVNIMGPMNWSDVTKYLKTLNTSKYSNWRLPIFEELYTISDHVIINESANTETTGLWLAKGSIYYTVDEHDGLFYIDNTCVHTIDDAHLFTAVRTTKIKE